MNSIHLYESTVGRISFDFDDTLCMSNGKPNMAMVEKLKMHHRNGHEVVIVTARNRDHESDSWIKENEPNRVKVMDFIKIHNLPVTSVYFTNHAPKGPILQQQNIFAHYDDDKDQLHSTQSHGVQAIGVGIDAKS
ncbi:MAG: HAD family hydrolase [Chitinophagaceae bacterium]|jgi:acid phosphatase class B